MNKIIEFLKNLFKGKEPIIPNEPGLLESPIDYRDISMGAVSKTLSPLPEEYGVPYILDIKNQGSKPICVGESTASLKEIKERQEQNFINFDPQWIYDECKKIDGMPNLRGTFFRAGLKVLKNIGAKPINGGVVGDFRIGGYIRTDAAFESLKRAIYEFNGVIAGFHGSNQGWKRANIRRPRPGEKQWGHAVLLVGFNKDHIVGQNSWGSAWGDKGYFYFDKNYLPFEAWVVISDFPSNWRELLKLDEPKTEYVFNNDLYFGMKNNEEVKILQKILKDKGCFPPKVNETGNYFMITMKAVRCYQARKGISQVGRFGPKTRAALNEELKVAIT